MKTIISIVILSFLVCLSAPAADLAKQVDDLIPKLASDNVEARYDYQMQLQDLASNTSRPGAELERLALGKIFADRILKPNVPQPAKIWMVRQLEYMGRGEAVPALTKLVTGSDEELRECARRALEKNDAPAAAASLRKALALPVSEIWQLGLIHALGEKRDAEAVSVIKPYLVKRGTAPTAAWALGKIASRDAISVLLQAWDTNNRNTGDALVVAARQLMAQGRNRPARAILKTLYESDRPVELRTAALSALFQADSSGADKLAAAALKSNSPSFRQIAIQAAAAQPKKVMPVLVTALPELSPHDQAQALAVVDSSAEVTTQPLTTHEDENVRLAAYRALGRIGNAETVPFLVKAAATRGGAEKSAAQRAIASLPGETVDQKLLEAASQGKPEQRVAAISALTDRQQKDALPEFVKFANEDNAEVSNAALSALRRMGSDAEVEPLANLVVKTGSSSAGGALKASVARAENKAAAGQTLSEISRGAQGKGLVLLLDVLPVTGGGPALDVVVAQLKSTDTDVQTAAVRALGAWPEFSAVDSLFQVAGNPDAEATHQILALRGLARLVRDSGSQDGVRRVQLAAKAFQLAKRNEEKKLIISALGAVQHKAAIAELQPLLANQALRTEAAQAGLQLARDLRDSDLAQAKGLAKAIADANISSDITKAARKLAK